MSKHFRIPGNLRARLEESGVDVSDVLHRAFLPQDLFDRVPILLNTDEMFAFWRAVESLSKDPMVGVRSATEPRIERFHPMAMAALCNETFGAAVAHFSRYKKLCSPQEIISTVADGEWTLQFRYLMTTESPPPIFLEHGFAWLFTIGRLGTGRRVSAARIELISPVKHVKALERHFGGPVVCGASRNAIVFDAKEVDAPFVTRNAELLEMLAPSLERELELKEQGEDGALILVRGAIRQQLVGNRPTIESVAKDLRMSPRSLQRKLQESGTTFQEVLAATRRELARYYLEQSILDVRETAYLLGYEDVSSFGRAFRAWEGTTPSQWREERRAVSAAV